MSLYLQSLNCLTNPFPIASPHSPMMIICLFLLLYDAFCRQRRLSALTTTQSHKNMSYVCINFIEMHAEIVMWNHYDDDDERMRCRLTIIQLIWFGHLKLLFLIPYYYRNVNLQLSHQMKCFISYQKFHFKFQSIT